MKYRHVWKTEVRRCVDKLGKRVFTLSDMYLFVDELKQLFPLSKNVDARIRENLQLLRDDGYIEFLDNNGTYRCLK